MENKKKNKRIILIIVSIVLLLSTGLLLYFFVLKDKDEPVKPVKEEITITFDTDGGKKIESIKVEKGKTVDLPFPEKDDYSFVGWYLEGKKVDENTIYDKDVTVVAKWEEKKTNAQYYKITFDSKGGSKVNSIEQECDRELELPKTIPTKDGYKFVSWVDKNDKPILDGAKLSCEDVTLYANWEKKEEEKKYYTVTFDSKGGSKVDSIKIECGKDLKLPANPTRDGYEFISWYDKNGKTMLNGAKLSCENLTLYADWKKKEEEKKYYTVTFDSKGGSKVDSIKVECGKELKLPTTIPTKDGYKFVSWVDKNEVPILDGAKLSCENVTLYANYQEYTCPTGYKRNGTKCVLEEDAKTKCSGDRVYEYEGKCVTISGTTRKDSVKECGTKIINTGGGQTPTVKGELFQLGTWYCFYKEVNDSYEQQSSNNCTSRGHKWNSKNNKCYYDRDDANVNITSACADNSYVYISNPNQFSGINGLNGGCFPSTDKTKYCADGFILAKDKCTKTVEATLK